MPIEIISLLREKIAKKRSECHTYIKQYYRLTQKKHPIEYDFEILEANLQAAINEKIRLTTELNKCIELEAFIREVILESNICC